MNDLIEVLFENIPEENVAPMLLEILRLSKSYKCLIPPPNESKKTLEDFNIPLNVLLAQGDYVVIFVLKKTMIFCRKIDHIVLRLTKFHDEYDIDFSFSEENTIEDNVDLLCDLFKMSNHFKLKFNISHCCAGMEPATDKETRYFTDDNFGPLLVDKFNCQKNDA